MDHKCLFLTVLGIGTRTPRFRISEQDKLKMVALKKDQFAETKKGRGKMMSSVT